MRKNLWMGALLAAVVALAATAMWQNRQIAQLKEQLASAAVEKAKAPPVSAAEKPLPEPPPPASRFKPQAGPSAPAVCSKPTNIKPE